MASTPRFCLLEFSYTKLAGYNATLNPPPGIRNGFCYVLNIPGLGHELTPGYKKNLLQSIPGRLTRPHHQDKRQHPPRKSLFDHLVDWMPFEPCFHAVIDFVASVDAQP